MNDDARKEVIDFAHDKRRGMSKMEAIVFYQDIIDKLQTDIEDLANEIDAEKERD